ncbi:MAG TPA: hypothetical protein VGH62_00985 [Bradyrhizobium sp.]
MSLNDTNQAKAPGKPRPLVLGLERIGLISLRFPLLVGLAALVLLVTAVFGIARTKVDDSLSHRDISGAFRTVCGTVRADEFAVTTPSGHTDRKLQ